MFAKLKWYLFVYTESVQVYKQQDLLFLPAKSNIKGCEITISQASWYDNVGKITASQTENK